jgi:hypothetical protein
MTWRAAAFAGSIDPSSPYVNSAIPVAFAYSAAVAV